MPPELLNILEISKIISLVTPSAGHIGLLEAINTRYPNTPFKLIQERDDRTWNIGIVDKTGNRVTDKLGQWIDQELAATGGDPKAVWEKYKGEGLLRSERAGSTLFLTASYGPEPDQFYQIEILAGEEIAEKILFRLDRPWDEFPEDRQDLVWGWGMADKRLLLAPARYEVSHLLNVRRFVKDLVEAERTYKISRLPVLEKKTIHVQEVAPGEMSEVYDVPYLSLCPNWLERLPAGLRLFVDWKESSAGQSGNIFCDHWWVQASEWKEKDGSRRYSLIPQWAENDGGLALPEIEPDWDDSPYLVMDQLTKFDKLAGYPFAWYFYMLHGNRVMPSAGGVVANALKDDKLRLPDCDETVLLRWREDQYGF